jgi:hypothetical protein
MANMGKCNDEEVVCLVVYGTFINYCLFFQYLIVHVRRMTSAKHSLRLSETLAASREINFYFY